MSSDPHPPSKSSKLIYNTNTHWVNNHDSKQYYFKNLMLNDMFFLINENKKNDIKKIFNKLNKNANKIIVINSTLSQEQKIKNLNKFIQTSTIYLNKDSYHEQISNNLILNKYQLNEDTNISNHLSSQTLKQSIQPNCHMYILISHSTNQQSNTIYVCHFDNECQLSHIKNIYLSQITGGMHDKYFEKEINLMNHFIENEGFKYYGIEELIELLHEQKGVPLSFINPLEKFIINETEFA